jgi:hypothetical protein
MEMSIRQRDNLATFVFTISVVITAWLHSSVFLNAAQVANHRLLILSTCLVALLPVLGLLAAHRIVAIENRLSFRRLFFATIFINLFSLLFAVIWGGGRASSWWTLHVAICGLLLLFAAAIALLYFLLSENSADDS